METVSDVDYLRQNYAESPAFTDDLEAKCPRFFQMKDGATNQTDDVQRLLVIKEEVPDDWCYDPESLHIKEEEEDHHQLDFSRFPFSVVVKDEDYEEKPLEIHPIQTAHDWKSEFLSSSSDEWIKTDPDGEEPDGNPNGFPQPGAVEKPSDSSETEVSDGEDDWREPLSHAAPEIGSSLDCNGGGTRKVFSCFQCDRQYLYKQSLHRHMKSHSGSTPGGGAVPGAPEPADPQRARAETEEKIFICDICGQRFNQSTNLNTHKRVHTGEKPFGCEECGKRFNQQGNLQSHRRVHTGEKPFECDYCGSRFRRQGSLQAHVRIHTGEKPFVCGVCGKKWARKVHFTTHMRVHTGERPFSCAVCGKEFSHQTHFKEHVRVHTGEKPFTCETCGKRFRLRCNLKRHTRVHTGEKPYACADCGKAFTCKTHLKRHMKVHTGERPFACEVCGERFAEPGVLKSHVRVHTGEKPYGCSVCGKSFRQQCTLKRHAVVHTGEKPHGCSRCGVRFSQLGNLKSHMKLHAE